MFSDVVDFDYESNKPKSHYEYVAAIDQPARVIWLKQQVFQSMNQLEGWCSYHKASILVDLVLLIQAETVVEIGVWGGKSLVPMAYALKELGRGKAYGIDPWQAVESVQGMDGVNKEWWGQVDHDAILRGLRRKILDFGLQDNIVLVRDTSTGAAPIPNIDLLHIDGNHSEEASCADVEKWVPLVRKGGIVILDDITWIDSTTKGSTRRAVELMNKYCIKLAEVHGDSDWGIWIKP